MVYGVCAFAWGFEGSLSLSVEEGRSTFGANGKNLSQILGDYQGRVESPPIIGFFLGVIGHLFLVDFIINPKLRKMEFFLI